MAKTPPSAGTSRDHHRNRQQQQQQQEQQQQQQQQQEQQEQQQEHQSRTTGSGNLSKSAPTTPSATTGDALPQCKVKRNYACAKCTYYTQNPRSFLHHQKNVHAERFRVYECSHCLYASRHSQKLHRHVQMVHQPNSKKVQSNNKVDEHAEESTKPLLVPPVRIRVPRFDKPYNEQKLSELVIVEDIDMNDAEQQSEVDDEGDVEEEEFGEEETDEAQNEQDLNMLDEEMIEGDLDDEDVDEEEEEDEGGEGEEEEEEEEDGQNDEDVYGSDDGTVDQDELSVTVVSPQSPTQSKHKKQNKLEKRSSTYIRCSVCSFGSHSQTLVNRHEKMAHLKKKFYRCMKCNYVTHMRARYTKHIKYHTMPMIKCDDCEFSTPYKWNLDRHNRNHSTVNPGMYKCSHCSFSADIKQSLTVHESNHHVPPVGGVVATVGFNRRKPRVGASDAPGSAVDGTEIVTYESTEDGGIVEIMTSKISAPTHKRNHKMEAGNNSVVTTNNAALTATTSAAPSVTYVTPPPTTSIKVISVVSEEEPKPPAAKDEKGPPRRRPMPKLIPIADQQRLTITPTIIRLPSPPVDETLQTATAGRSVSPKNKIASFFDKLKAKVDETADLTCSVCQFESKCLSEFMRHQRMHGNNDVEDTTDDASASATTVTTSVVPTSSNRVIIVDKAENIELTLQPPPPPVTAAELKSTRCQRCRKRCKTSTELVVHLATCRGAATVAAVNNANRPTAASGFATDEKYTNNGQNGIQQQPQHPMENKIFVWNTTVIPAPHCLRDDEEQHSVTLTEIITPPSEQEIKKQQQQQQHEQEEDVDEEEVEDEEDDDDDDEEDNEEIDNDHNEELYQSNLGTQQYQQQQLTDKQKLKLKQQKLQKQQPITKKEGKIHKTVFKCPHCTFWAATASRFHVHIVGHLNRKPFECSCCAYRSNWRWDITKHIRLKSARRPGLDDSLNLGNSHHGAKVLMTDETGRRNYSKYNGYLTVMELDISDGFNKAAGGDCEDSKGLISPKMGGGTPRKRRITAAAKAHALFNQQQATSTPTQEQNQNSTVNPSQSSMSSSSSPSSSTVTVNDNRCKTVWKCKKCFFRDCDRLTVLNHVKEHYRRGEFDTSTSDQSSSQQNLLENNMKTKKTTEPKELSDQKPLTNDRRKSKIPTTGTVNDSILMMSANPNYEKENILACPLCDVNVGTSNQLKDHMKRTHFSGETKYRCEYCQFWSEDKKVMLEHMTVAHEMGDRIKIDINPEVNDRSKQYNESNSIEDVDIPESDAEIRGIDENGSSNDMTNMEVVFESSDENIVVYETVECKSNCNDNTRETTLTTQRESLDKSSYDSTTADEKMNEIIINSGSDNGEEQVENEQVDNEEIIVRADEVVESAPVKLKIVKAVTTATSEPITKNQTLTTIASELSVKWPIKGTHTVYECNDCSYFSDDKKKLQTHKELHVKRGALFNCAQCVFNVTNSSMLYHHYRYGHIIEEPELRYPEDIIIQTGHKDMIAKNSADKLESKLYTVDDDDPPMVWFYNKNSEPPFSKVYRCRYCPHTNRRRHNTVEHERMHSDHPEHQSHRQQQQRMSGTSPTQSPLHPCKRCTYVCNNAGVLASHLKVHSGVIGSSAVGFYDGTITDAMQVRALEYVMELENDLKNSKQSGTLSHNKKPFEISDDSDTQSDEIFTELDEPELKFCPYCPARFFFRSDLRCHIRFHKVRVWDNSCDCCSFTVRTMNQITAHEIVHCDEYAQRTAELLSSGYPVSQRYPRPSEYPASANGGNSPRWTRVRTRSLLRSPKHESVENKLPEPRRQLLSRTTKRLRPCNEPNNDTLAPEPPLEKQKYVEKNQRPQRTIKSPKTPPKVQNNKGGFFKIKPTNLVRQFMCEKCPGKFFKSSALKYHKTLHGGPGKHNCRRCDYAVSTYGNLIRHESVHKDLPPREKIRLLIAKTPKSKDKCTEDTEPTTTLISTPMPSPPPSKPILLTPQPTKKTSKSDDDKNNDNNSFTSSIDEDFSIDPEFGPAMLGNPIFNYPATIKNGVSRPKRYKCSKCPSAFDKREQYAVHLTLHGANDKYQCDKCDYSVRYTANYIQHKRKHARDAEIRKNIEQAAAKTEMIANQEKESNSQRGRHKLIPLNVLIKEEPEFSLENELMNESIKKEPESPIKEEPDCPIKEEPESPIEDELESSESGAVKLTEPLTTMKKTLLMVPKMLLPVTKKKLLPLAPKKMLSVTPTLMKWEPRNMVIPAIVKLDPNNTVFRNEISDRQTAYELNAAYGATGIVTDGIGELLTLFRCSMCPYEGDDRSQLDQHILHHTDASVEMPPDVNATTWKLACRFCTYRTQGDADLTDHIRVHFLRSTGTVLASYAAAAGKPKGDSNIDTVDPTDHVEFHGKRIVYNQRRRSKGTGNSVADSEDSEIDVKVENNAEKPFFVFKDQGIKYGNGLPDNNGRTVRFSPDCQPPPVLIDYNDNRTSATSTADKLQQTAFVRLVDRGKRLEFRGNDAGAPSKKRKRGKK